MVACKRNPKLAYVRKEGTAKQQAFPVVIRSREFDAFKGYPPFGPFLDPPFGDWPGDGTVRDFYRAGNGHSQRSCGGVRVARSVSMMDQVMELLKRSASPPDIAAEHAEYVFSV